MDTTDLALILSLLILCVVVTIGASASYSTRRERPLTLPPRRDLAALLLHPRRTIDSRHRYIRERQMLAAIFARRSKSRRKLQASSADSHTGGTSSGRRAIPSPHHSITP